MEKLRVDLSDVQDRIDLEAELIQQAIDPQVVLDILQETLKQVSSIESTNREPPKEELQ